MERIEYIVYYKLHNNSFRAWNSKTDICYDIMILPKHISNFNLSKGYEPTDEDLKRYFNLDIDDKWKDFREIYCSSTNFVKVEFNELILT